MGSTYNAFVPVTLSSVSMDIETKNKSRIWFSDERGQLSSASEKKKKMIYYGIY